MKNKTNKNLQEHLKDKRKGYQSKYTFVDFVLLLMSMKLNIEYHMT